MSIPSLFMQLGEKSVFAVIQENMPEIDTSKIRQQGPVPTNGTPSPTPTPSPQPTTVTPSQGNSGGPPGTGNL